VKEKKFTLDASYFIAASAILAFLKGAGFIQLPVAVILLPIAIFLLIVIAALVLIHFNTKEEYWSD